MVGINWQRRQWRIKVQPIKRPIPPASQHQSIASRVLRGAPGAMRSHGPDRTRPNFVRLSPWMNPHRTHRTTLEPTLTFVHQGVQQQIRSTLGHCLNVAAMAIGPVIKDHNGRGQDRQSENGSPSLQNSRVRSGSQRFGVGYRLEEGGPGRKKADYL
jgi:hypothetical protein